MRGEYYGCAVHDPHHRELPPRARRILIQQRIRVVHGGTTSACAENTQLCSKLFESRWNYLRVRGEYISLDTTARSHKELPPRARRILHGKSMISTSVGTTSACAENTGHMPILRFHHRNYLRVRGEYPRGEIAGITGEELPPRARRIPVSVAQSLLDYGTTSACAENTAGRSRIPRRQGNYLRVRGEYSFTVSMLALKMELPPRARRILVC